MKSLKTLASKTYIVMVILRKYYENSLKINNNYDYYNQLLSAFKCDYSLGIH